MKIQNVQCTKCQFGLVRIVEIQQDEENIKLSQISIKIVSMEELVVFQLLKIKMIQYFKS
ncbi:unnamed protein product [Paramecium primaurelia]|uniref:Uncharacterized protein n=1 Tax=Paramecium primaurelia TaxID=5886 RepID=A0A8S1QQ34_PARPR|nr:unnamed protein product [Paramecium primaurelia]